jgi:hypothetical protein
MPERVHSSEGLGVIAHR